MSGGLPEGQTHTPRRKRKADHAFPRELPSSFGFPPDPSNWAFSLAGSMHQSITQPRERLQICFHPNVNIQHLNKEY